MPLAPQDVLADFAHEALYEPAAWFVHRIVQIDPDANTLVAEMDTNDLMMVAEQRVLPGHPKHVPAAVAVQATGTLGHLYATYVLGFRATEGWVGFGTHITRARWGKMGLIGPPVTMTCVCDKQRRLWDTTFCEFSFRFVQQDEVIYTSRQTAAWRRGAA